MNNGTEPADEASGALLVSVVRGYLNGFNADGLVESARRMSDWKGLMALADAHRVSPIVRKGLSALPAGAVPENVQDRLRAGYERNAVRNLRMIGELRRLYDLLDGHGIRAVPIKGPVLAMSTYGDPGDRKFDDLDILVPRDRVVRTRDLLAAEGFRSTTDLHWHCESAYFRPVESEFSMARGDLSVDIHWRLTADYLPYQADLPKLWSDLTTVSIAGRAMRTLGPEHQLLFLAAHGTKHRWARLGWICDFAKCLQANPVDWPRMIEIAGLPANRLMLCHALAVVRDIAGVSTPPEAQAWMAACPGLEATTRRLAPGIAANLQRKDPLKSGFRQTYRYACEFGRGPFAAPRILHGMWIAPRETDWQAVHLPPAAYSLYYPIRMARLAAKYTVGRIRPASGSQA